MKSLTLSFPTRSWAYRRWSSSLRNAYDLVSSGGYVLLEIPALQWLYSEHDKTLGHYRRYYKKLKKSMLDPNKFEIVKLWFQDPIGVLDSLLLFKIKKLN